MSQLWNADKYKNKSLFSKEYYLQYYTSELVAHWLELCLRVCVEKIRPGSFFQLI